MPGRPALTFVLMDPPFEDARSTTALRLIGAALRRGCHVNVFAYEGAVGLAQLDQREHREAGAEHRPHALPNRWIAALLAEAAERGLTVDWVHCAASVVERGADDPVAGVRLGGPAELQAFVARSANTLVIPTR